MTRRVRNFIDSMIVYADSMVKVSCPDCAAETNESSNMIDEVFELCAYACNISEGLPSAGNVG